MCFKVKTVLCLPPDGDEKCKWRADRPVSPGVLPHHQLCCHGDQGSEEEREGREHGGVL